MRKIHYECYYLYVNADRCYDGRDYFYYVEVRDYSDKVVRAGLVIYTDNIELLSDSEIIDLFETQCEIL